MAPAPAPKTGGPSSAIVPASGFASAAEPKDWWCGSGAGSGWLAKPGALAPGADAKFGGATPTIVPFRRLRACGGAAPAGGAPNGPAPKGPGSGGAPAPIGGASAVKPGAEATPAPDAGDPTDAGGAI